MQGICDRCLGFTVSTVSHRDVESLGASGLGGVWYELESNLHQRGHFGEDFVMCFFVEKYGDCGLMMHDA